MNKDGFLLVACGILCFSGFSNISAQPTPSESDAATRSTDHVSEKPSESLLKTRIQADDAKNKHFYSISTFRPNYFLPIVYTKNFNRDAFQNSEELVGDARTLKNVEGRFQFSVKIPMAKGIFMDQDSVFFGFTQKAFWQIYASDNSRPFRENVYIPEVFWRAPIELIDLPIDLGLIGLGISHESNGRSGELSRSWDRLYTVLTLEKNDWVYELTPWWRIPESAKKGGANSRGDDNPDIEKYLGHFEFRMTGFWLQQEVSFMFRHNLRAEQRGAIEMNWLIPLSDKFKTIITGFNGYGESLIDYDRSTTSVSFGILLNSWL